MQCALKARNQNQIIIAIIDQEVEDIQLHSHLQSMFPRRALAAINLARAVTEQQVSQRPRYVFRSRPLRQGDGD